MCKPLSLTSTATTTPITLSLHDALPIYLAPRAREPDDPLGELEQRHLVRIPEIDGLVGGRLHEADRKSTRLNSSHSSSSYAVFCLNKKRRCRSDLTVHLRHRQCPRPLAP